MDLPNMTLVECTVDQARQARRNTFTTWGQPLGFSESDWISRFEVLEADTWAEGDRYKCWALVPRDTPDTLKMLAHCETFRRPSLAISPGSTTVDDVLSYGIAGVFTPVDKRGHGYARQLLRILHYVIAPTDVLPPWPTAWGRQPEITGFKDAAFSVLYSGVGDKYYASCRRGDAETSLPGWERQHVAARYWNVPPAADETAQSWGRWVPTEGLKDLELRTSEQMRKDLTSSHLDEYRVAILPTESLFRIHTKRYELSPAYERFGPRHYGLVLDPDPKPKGSSSPPDAPFIVYTFPESNSEQSVLEITYVHPPFPFEAALAAARKEGCETIKIWGERGQWDEQDHRLEKDLEMPCLVSYLHPTGQTRWEWLEQYTWC